MKQFQFFMLKLGLFALAVGSRLVHAAESAEEDDPWVTEVLRADFSAGYHRDLAADPFTSPPSPDNMLPRADDSEEAWQRYAVGSTRRLSPFLQEIGCPVPVGTVLIPDAWQATLAVHTRQSALSKLRLHSRRLLTRFPETFDLRGTLYAGDASLLFPLVNQVSSQASHSEAVAQLETLLKGGKVQLLDEWQLYAKPEQSTKLENHTDRSHRKENETSDSDAVAIGTTVEAKLSNTVGDGGIALSLSFSHAARTEVSNPEDKTRIDLAEAHASSVKLNISSILAPAEPHIVAAWTPPETVQTSGQRQLHLLVVKAHMNRVLPPGNDALKTKLTQVLPKAKAELIKTEMQSASEAEPPKRTPPPGMETRVIKVPPKFLEKHPPEQILNANIPLPEGSSCVFHTHSRTLELVNTPANLDAIARLAAAPEFQNDPVIRKTVYLVRGDRQMIGKWVEELDTNLLPQLKWKEFLEVIARLPEQAKVVEVASLESRPGERNELFVEGVEHDLAWMSDSVAARTGTTMDCNLLFNYARKLPLHAKESHNNRLMTSLILIQGTPCVIGEWIPVADTGAPARDQLQIAVLKLEAVRRPVTDE
ncbi:hypothetical protein [Verrucomicrobium sp. BvORR034]|uniref:hypothetical protein n=1 Tax=Verrucomicrobium sp. BvORR034 TaxID=1396418 RepID=UPI0006787F3C|nr:hypothetical protein [Verrucomicrobium sp. BvORR034]